MMDSLRGRTSTTEDSGWSTRTPGLQYVGLLRGSQQALQRTHLMELWAWPAVRERSLTGRSARRTFQVSSGQCCTEGLGLVLSSSRDVLLLAVSCLRGLCENAFEQKVLLRRRHRRRPGGREKGSLRATESTTPLRLFSDLWI